jgi:hypothetical protein
MGLYYIVIDPSIFIITIALCVSTIIMMQQKNEIIQYSKVIYTLLGLTIFYGVMFLLFNFRFIHNRHNNKNKRDVQKKSNYALYYYGTLHRYTDINFYMIILAFAGFMAALTMISFGIYFIILGNSHSIDKNENENGNIISIPSNIKTMLIIIGVMCIICGIIAIARLPSQYLLFAMELEWAFRLYSNMRII